MTRSCGKPLRTFLLSCSGGSSDRVAQTRSRQVRLNLNWQTWMSVQLLTVGTNPAHFHQFVATVGSTSCPGHTASIDEPSMEPSPIAVKDADRSSMLARRACLPELGRSDVLPEPRNGSRAEQVGGVDPVLGWGDARAEVTTYGGAGRLRVVPGCGRRVSSP